ncbi:phospholipase D family protein [Sphingobium fuliginis]|uniref:Phospholipase D-like domain-containing protein n=1 Tax=Sphingobium fuliginis (strain ATCC 27551) TaxID=336203 RepID=A0A292ZDN2_SPHSA|nr:phospholipase D family protein [Sphingobium fuliginis]GAY20969.1 hypothetical protein SFOMI_1499 [Sphingobium fuliginis]
MKRLFGAGVALHAVDPGTRHLLFHPKLYYIRGKDIERLSIGSANLTLDGLNNNIQARLARITPATRTINLRRSAEQLFGRAKETQRRPVIAEAQRSPLPSKAN